MSSINHFFLPPEAFVSSKALFDSNLKKQIVNVLRLTPGEEIMLLDGLGKAYHARLARVDRQEVSAELVGEASLDTELPVPLHLFLAMTQREKLELILQKVTELGVASITLMHTERSLVAKREEDEAKRSRRLQIIREAAEQSHRLFLPALHAPVKYDEALKNAQRVGQVLVCHKGSQVLLCEAMERDSGTKAKCIFIGPEGGFSEDEIVIAGQAGVEMVSLGKRILRMETAAIAALAICGVMSL